MYVHAYLMHFLSACIKMHEQLFCYNFYNLDLLLIRDDLQ